MKEYKNPHCLNVDEFNEDLNRIKYIKKLFKRYIDSGELRERLILNHLIIFYNVFEREAATRMLFCKMEPEYWGVLKSFLMFLNLMPIGMVRGIRGTDIHSADVVEIPEILSVLKEI